jgi:hypothetical protein
MNVISEGVREVHETMADVLRAEGRVEGRVAAKAEALLRVIGHRAWPITEPLRERVLTTSDEQQLQQWFDRAFTVGSVEEVFQVFEA